MKFILLIVAAIFFSVLVFTACKTKKKALSTVEDTPTIKLEAGSCFGKCKVYNYSVFSDGTAELEGIKNIDKGITKSKIEPKSLITTFEENDFAAMKNEYLSGARDLQKFKITYQSKTIIFNKNRAPKELLNILETLKAAAFKVE